MKPSILDRVKANLQAVFTRHQLSDEQTGSETADTHPVVPDTVDADAGSSLPWLTMTQRTIFQQRERGSTTEQRFVNRARILLSCDTLQAKTAVARSRKIDITTVRLWHARWDAVRVLLSPLEAAAVPRRTYRRVLEEALQDAPRRGAPMSFTAEHVAQIVAMACEKLDDAEAPVSHWTHGHVAAEAVERDIVESISPFSVRRFVTDAALKPHLTQG